jgi:hypothetical protein
LKQNRKNPTTDPTGSEQPVILSGNSTISTAGGAKSGALTGQVHLDLLAITVRHPELRKLIEVWSSLPQAMRIGIMAMVNATNSGH